MRLLSLPRTENPDSKCSRRFVLVGCACSDLRNPHATDIPPRPGGPVQYGNVLALRGRAASVPPIRTPVCLPATHLISVRRMKPAAYGYRYIGAPLPVWG